MKSIRDNIIIAVSNLIPISLVMELLFNANKFHSLLMLLTMTSSYLYHLSETKHKLPGHPFLRNYSGQLLWLDRICAYISGGVVAYQILCGYAPMTPLLLLAIGLASLLLLESEGNVLFNFIEESPYYTITHSMWHVTAFYVFYEVTKNQ